MSSEIDLATKELNEALKQLKEASTFDEYAEASAGIFSNVTRNEQIEEARKLVDQKRQELFNTVDSFRMRMQANMEGARMNAAMRSGSPGGSSGFPMPHGGMMGPMARMPGVAGFGAQMPINPVIPPLDTELIWACPECGNKNVNWKTFKGKGMRKRYAKRYNLDEREIKKGVRYCIQCSQRTGKDVRMERIRLADVLKIREDYAEKKIDGKLFVKE